MPVRFVATLAALAALVPASAQVAAPAIAPAQVAAARASIEQLIEDSGTEVAVVWRPLHATAGSTPDSWPALAINDTVRFHAASTMKVPIMVELFKQAADGRLALDDQIPVTNRFRSIVDGSPYELSATEDSDGETYRAIGQMRSYRTLNDAMITVSSNLAANILIDRLGPGNIKTTLASLDASGMEVLRGVEDQKAFDRGMNNTTDARGLGQLLWKIGRGEAVSREASAEMVEVMKRQKFRDGIPAGVPAGTEVAHKTGWITRIRHDAGIVYASRPYVLVVLTRGFTDPKQADALIAQISKRLYALTTG